MEKFVKKIKRLQLVGKENRRSSFIKRIMEKDRTTEMKEGRITIMKEDRTTGMIEDLITDSTENETENPIPKKSNAMVAKDMVI